MSNPTNCSIPSSSSNNYNRSYSKTMEYVVGLLLSTLQTVPRHLKQLILYVNMGLISHWWGIETPGINHVMDFIDQFIDWISARQVILCVSDVIDVQMTWSTESNAALTSKTAGAWHDQSQWHYRSPGWVLVSPSPLNVPSWSLTEASAWGRLLLNSASSAE